MASQSKTNDNNVNMPEEQIAELELVFEKFDPEGDHMPFSEELENMVRLLGYDPDWKELRYLQSKLRGLDIMHFNQFAKIMAEEEERTEGKRGYEEEEILSIFKSWDPDNTGFISKETFVTNMTTRGDPLEEDELEELLNEMMGSAENKDQDVIEYEPFVRKMFGLLTEVKTKHEKEVIIIGNIFQIHIAIFPFQCSTMYKFATAS